MRFRFQLDPLEKEGNSRGLGWRGARQGAERTVCRQRSACSLGTWQAVLSSSLVQAKEELFSFKEKRNSLGIACLRWRLQGSRHARFLERLFIIFVFKDYSRLPPQRLTAGPKDNYDQGSCLWAGR